MRKSLVKISAESLKNLVKKNNIWNQLLKLTNSVKTLNYSGNKILAHSQHVHKEGENDEEQKSKAEDMSEN